MMVPLTMREILPTFLPVRFRMVKLTISVPPLEILFRRAKPIPVPITTPPKQGVHDRVIGERNYWDKLDKEGTHGHRDKGENGKLMANLIPGDDH